YPGLPALLESCPRGREIEAKGRRRAMRILHTADWHLGDRLGRINRTAELRRAVEHIAAFCEAEGVEVLLVAGGLFSDRCGQDGLRDAIEHLQRTFLPFLRRGGTIVA